MTPIKTISLWKAAFFCPGPRPLSRLYCFGVVLTVTSLLAAVLFAAIRGFWQINELPSGEKWSSCTCQLVNRKESYNEKCSRIRTLDAFITRIQSDPEDLRNYTSPGIEEFKAGLAGLKIQQTKLQGDSIQRSLPGLIVLLALTIAFSLLAARLTVRHASHIGLISPSAKELSGWKWPFWIFVLALFSLQEFRELKTSVLAQHKIWFGWQSFCLCTPAWIASQFMALGAYVVISYPACLIWCLSRNSYRPNKLERDFSDGAWGVGGYVLFAQTWSLSMFILLLVPILLWIRSNSQYVSLIYLLPTVGLLFGAAIVAARLLRNVIQLRLMYQNELQSLGSWTKIQAINPPPDPTSSFLGDRWWNLPAVILATIASFWAVIEWSGIGKLLEGLLFGGH